MYIDTPDTYKSIFSTEIQLQGSSFDNLTSLDFTVVIRWRNFQA